MNAEPRTFVLDVDTDLLEHRTHLPETDECICGYVREEAATLAA